MQLEHPLTRLFADLARGVHPAQDDMTEVMPRAVGAEGAILGFTGHYIVAANVDHDWVAHHCPAGDLRAPVSPDFLLQLAQRLNASPSAARLVLCAPGEASEPALALSPIDPDAAHPRVTSTHVHRTDVRVYRTPDGRGLLTVGRGLAGRWEAGLRVSEQYRNTGIGRALAVASRSLVKPGEPVFMQVAIANIASLRTILAAGFTPVCTEILFDAHANDPQHPSIGRSGTTDPMEVHHA